MVLHSLTLPLAGIQRLQRKIVVSRTGTGRRVRKKGLQLGRLNTRENWWLFGSLFIVLSELQCLDLLFGAAVVVWLFKIALGGRLCSHLKGLRYIIILECVALKVYVLTTVYMFCMY